ncbi:aminopeptidase N [Thiohalophilus sp.]|uniref:aminopeptidase N n=1 Tax=Thiohalophilus sp. TaxID=3028392 RepID=UPI002ACEA050|nr:aminopeptidase N [Thiohalophilus sp.]MDZ7804093.1 aminopeptidase N [Thiohalophilus sp.]
MADLAGNQSGPNVVYLKDYTPPAYLIDKVDLHFDLDAATTQVRATLKVRRNPEHPDTNPPLSLDGSHLELLSLRLEGEPLSEAQYRLAEEKLTISDVPEQFELIIETRINPAANTALEGLYYSGNMLCTQCEAQGFRRITYFPDRPDVMSCYTVTLVGDQAKYPVLLSNGNRVEAGETDDGRHWARWEDPSLKPSYLFALVAGQLVCQEDTYTTMSGREVVLRLYVEEENRHKCDHAMTSLKQAMRWDEETYGREYDLDIYMIVAVNDFNMGAMENKGLNIFNSSCVLASPETATDHDFYNIQSIVAHEYFHNWSGNRVTCRDWFQLSLKEGFTVFRDQEFSADLNSRAVKRIDDVNILRTHQFAQDAGPMAHPVRPDRYMEISNFYTVTVYNKGAEVVRMIMNLVGREGFRRGTDLYFARHDGQAVTIEDFVRAMEETNHIDLSQFMRWYNQAGTPVLKVGEEFDEQAQTYTLHIKQNCPPTPGQPEKQPFHIPLAVGLLDRQGDDLVLQLEGESAPAEARTRVLSVTEPEQSFTFTGMTHQPVASLGRGFSAPIRIQAGYDDDKLAFLFAHDSDEFNRWDAGQQLAMNILLRLIEQYQQKKPLTLDESFILAFRKTLLNADLDKALIAQALSLPSEGYIADQCEVVDVEAIFEVRHFMRQTLAFELKDEWQQIYQANSSDKPYAFNAEEMARRALRNLCLGYLLETEEQAMFDLAMQQYSRANNMTDTLAALSMLANFAIPKRHQALEGFYQKWQHDQQVVEKWLAIQAGSRLPRTLQHVRQLMEHEAFSIKNPNKVRALIGRFCAGNPINFHAADGSGYRFLGDQVLELDSLNPQIAARLVQNLSRWKRYDEKRQGLMKQQLERILDKEGLSKDVYEVASKSLDA